MVTFHSNYSVCVDLGDSAISVHCLGSLRVKTGLSLRENGTFWLHHIRVSGDLNRQSIQFMFVRVMCFRFTVAADHLAVSMQPE